MTLNIRQYTGSDLQSVLAAWDNASHLAHPFLTTEFQNKVRQDIPELYIPNAETWVAEINDEVVGFISLINNEVGALFVQPEFHGNGVGKALMDQAKKLHRELELEVFKENPIGRNFYAKNGFKLVREEIHEATGNDVLRLRYTA